MVEELAFRFVGYDLLSGVAGAVGNALDGILGKAVNTKDKMANAFMDVGSAGMAMGAGMVASGLAVAAGMAYAVHAAADFQSQLVLLHTHADVASDTVKNVLGPAILELAGQVGFSPTSLAQAMYHVESVMTSLPKNMQNSATAMDILTRSAELAKIGHADLQTTVDAVSVTLGAYAKMGYNASQVTGILNATIGEGNMRLNDLVTAYGTGLLPVMQNAGVRLESVGAAMATLTDVGIPASRAATYLRSAMIEMTIPTNSAVAALKAIGVSTSDSTSQIGAFSEVLKKAGINQTDVAQELRKTGSLAQTMDFLKEKLQAAGLSGEEAGALLAKAFGGIRSGTGVQGLINNLDSLNQKEADLTRRAGDFQATWDYFNRNDPNQTFDRLTANLQALAIVIGMALLPAALQFVQAITPMVVAIMQWVAANPQLVAQILIATTVILTLGGAIIFVAGFITHMIGVVMAVGAALAAMSVPVWVAIAVFVALIAIGVLLVTHWQQILTAARTIWNQILPAIRGPLMMVWQLIMTFINFIRPYWNTFQAELYKVVVTYWPAIRAILIAVLLIIIAVIVIFIAILAALVVAFLVTANAVLRVLEVLSKIPQLVMTILGLLHQLWNTLSQDAVAAFNTVVSAVGSFIARVTSAIGSFFSNLGAMVEQAWSTFTQRPLYWLAFLLAYAMAWTVLMYTRFFEWLVQMVVAAAEGFARLFVTVTTALARLAVAIAQFVVNSSVQFTVWMARTIQLAVQTGVGVLSAILNTIPRLPGIIAGVLGQAISAVISWEGQMIGAMYRAGASSAESAKSGLSGLPGMLASVGSAAVHALANAIRNGAGAVAGAAASVARGAFDGAMAALGAHSPSRLFTELGENVNQGFAIGILNSKAQPMAAVAQTISGMTPKTGPSSANVSLNNQNQTEITLVLDKEVLAKVSDKNMRNQFKRMLLT